MSHFPAVAASSSPTSPVTRRHGPTWFRLLSLTIRLLICYTDTESGPMGARMRWRRRRSPSWQWSGYRLTGSGVGYDPARVRGQAAEGRGVLLCSLCRLGAGQRIKSLGLHGHLTPDTARAQAIAALGKAAVGIDPFPEAPPAAESFSAGVEPLPFAGKLSLSLDPSWRLNVTCGRMQSR